MENRLRDQMSQRTKPTEAGEINRHVEERKSHEDGSTLDFGKNIARSEEPLGDENDTGRTGSSAGRH
jgi:hypothetical protein